MNCEESKPAGRYRALRACGRDVVVLAWFFLYALLTVGTHLVYQAQVPAFSLRAGFARPYLGVPGGPASYLSLFLAQLFAWDWLGALVLTLEAGLLLALAQICCTALAGRPLRLLRFLPLALFAMLAGRYDQTLAAGPALLVGLAAAALYVRLPIRRPALRAANYLALAAGVYYLASGAVGKVDAILLMLDFAAVCGLYEARWGSRRLALAALPAAVGVLLAGDFLVMHAEASWTGWTQVPATWRALLTIALFASPLPMAAAAGSRLSAKLLPSAPSAPAAGARQALDPRLAWLLQTAALVWAISSLCLYVSFDGAARDEWEIHYDVMNGRWKEMMTAAARVPPERYTEMLSFDINTALYHNGTLAEEMFQYGQKGSRMMLPFKEPAPFVHCYRQVETCLRLGRLGDAEHLGCEEFIQYGTNPYVLRQLSLVEMAKGKLPAARVFLNLLSGDVVHGAWARRYLRLLEDERKLAADPEIRSLREVALTRDDVQKVVLIVGENERGLPLPEQMLLDLLAENPHNRMAFEYLMASYLLGNRLEAFVRELHRLDDFGIKELPRS